MALAAQERRYVIRHAVELLKHRHRDRLLDILAARLAHDDYPDARERALDAITLAIARAIDEQLEAEAS